MRANLASRPPIERVRQILEYEPVTGRLLWRVTSGRAIAGREAGNFDKTIGYRRVPIDGKSILAHHVVWGIVKGVWPAQLDHTDGDKANNRIENLRESDQRQNLANIGRPRHNTSGKKGVSFHKATGMWQAQINIAKKKKYLGTFSTADEAHAAYLAAAIAEYGEFARGEDFAAPAPQIVEAKRASGKPSIEELRSLLSYDPKTGDVRWLKALGWRGQIGAIAGRLNQDGYRRTGLFGKQYATHVIIWAMQTGAWPTLIVDHIDSNRSNNAWSNLQEITQSENVRKALRPSPYPRRLLPTS